MCVRVCVRVRVRVRVRAGGADIVCLSLISLGVQTCGEDHMTSWRTQDCRASDVKTSPDPFGWYLKPGTHKYYTHTVQVHTQAV